MRGGFISEGEFTDRISARPLSQLLQSLLALKNHAPLCEFYFITGNVMRGWLRNVDGSHPNGSSMVIEMAGEKGQRTNRVLFVEGHSLVMVSCEPLGEALIQLSDGRVDSLDLEESPGKLELDRQVQTLGGDLSKMLEKTIPIHLNTKSYPDDQDRDRAAIRELISNLSKYFSDLYNDDFSKKEVSKKIDRITIGNGPKKATLHDQHLVIEIPVKGSFHERFQKEELKESINILI